MASNYKLHGVRADFLRNMSGHSMISQAYGSRAKVIQSTIERGSSPQFNSTRARIVNGLPKRRLKSVYRIIIRSFISAEKVGFGPSIFLGDNRGPSAEVNRNIGFRAMHKFDVFVSPGNKYLRTYRQRSSATVGVVTNIPAGSPLILIKHAQTQITPSLVTQERNSLGNTITSFETSYWAKDPVTPQFATPALDIHAKFALTTNENQDILYVTAIVSGDLFPSTEVILVDPKGTRNILLGAHLEKGGLIDLFGDNNKLLIDIDLRIKLDSFGNFYRVHHGYRDYSIGYWNQQIINKNNKKP